ncbi:MAG: LCP family protein [Streptosporangiaceae bacterium]
MAAWTAVCLAAALVAGALTAYVKYREVWHSIKRVHVTDLGKRPPVYSSTSLNILLIGSDSRSGRNARFGAGVQGQRSDTIMLLHISPGRRRATVLSIPRDSVVPILACQKEPGFTGQVAQPGQVEQVNSSFAFGGPGCLWKTVEQLTQIHIDHFIELNFTGFEKVINDIGGVNICLPWAINDPRSKLHLSKGLHHVLGAKALAFWRVRYIGEGSDLERIQRDQYLMASLVQGIRHSGLLTSPTQIYSVITDAARAMTTDASLSLGTMIRIAESLHGLSSQSVQFIQVPAVAYPANPNWVQWAQAAKLFSAIAHDRSVPRTVRHQTKGAAPALAATAAAQVRVRVLNGSGVTGIAGAAAAGLTSRGFNVTGTGDAARSSYTRSVIDYSTPAELGAARTLSRQLADVTVRRSRALTPGTLELIVGSAFRGLTARAAPGRSALAAPSAAASPSAQSAAKRHSPVSDLTQTYGGITGNANVCHDTTAFAGPDGRS